MDRLAHRLPLAANPSANLIDFELFIGAHLFTQPVYSEPALVKGEQQDVSDDDVSVEFTMKQLCVIGDKRDVQRQLEALWDTTGGFGTLLMIAHDWDDKARWMRTMELLANEIVPAMPTLERVRSDD